MQEEIQDGFYEAYWPRSARQTGLKPLAQRLESLEGKTVAQLWDYLFRGDEIFPLLEEGLQAAYPGVRFVNFREFGSTHSGDEKEILAALPHMRRQGQGRIVNICSVQSALARPGIAPYTASKGAVANLTKGMATDWAKHGLQVNGLAPGYFETELNAALVADPDFSAWLKKRTPAGRWGKVEELVGAAIFLAGDSASFVNGHILYVDGGITASL